MGAPALAELAEVPWRERTTARQLRRDGRVWQLWTVSYTVPWIAAGVVLMALEPLAFPVAAVAIAHAWIMPELQAFRGANSVKPRPRKGTASEAVAQGFLGDLLGHEARDLHRETGLAMQRGELGVWLIGERGALLIPYRSRRVHAYCVGTNDPELPPSDRIAHLLLALQTDEEGFATVANRNFCGDHSRLRRRLRKEMRPALDAAVAASRRAPASR